MILRSTLVALLLATAACGGGGDDEKPEDSGTSDAGGNKSDGGTATDATVGADTSTPVPVTPDKVTNSGKSCTTSNSCEGVGPNCMTSLALGPQPITFPGGYCSATCKDNKECGSSGECPVGESLKALPSFGGFDISSLIPSNCFVRCQADSECRTGEGYRCATILSALSMGAALNIAGLDISALLTGPIKDNKYCLPPAPPAPEAGVDAGKPADAGAADTGAADTGAADTGAQGDAAQGDV